MKELALVAQMLRFLGDYGAAPAPGDEWKIKWQDDFSVFDEYVWIKGDFAVHVPEPQIYLAQNVSCHDGTLRLTLGNQPFTCPEAPRQTIWSCGPAIPGTTYAYTSGWVETNGAHDTQFGYLEAKIKFPHGRGFWPAFWTWRGAGGPTTNEAEIDIAELLGRLPPTITTTNTHVHYPDSYYEEFSPAGFDYRDWHVYGMWWTKEHLIWYLDGKILRYMKNPGIIDPVRIIFGIGIEPNIFPDKKTKFPATMEVDYLRVYEDLSTRN